MMPKMRQALKGLGRRVSCQVIKKKVLDHEAVQQGIALQRASILLSPMPARKIAVKPEGQRTWKWWSGISRTQLELGCFLKPDKDSRKLYEVMDSEDWSQAGIFNYGLAEAPR
jgi:hypothetical protein